MARSADITRPDLRADRRTSRRQMSLMHAFRVTAEAGDARVAPRTINEDEAEERDRRDRRVGIDEAELRRHLALDLESLIATIRLDAIAPLEDNSRVARSIVNFGFSDLSRASVSTASRKAIGEAIRLSLIAFEPRLIERSIEVALADEDQADPHKLTFHVQAEISADPADLPLDFLAEVDLGAGKLRSKRLRLQR